MEEIIIEERKLRENLVQVLNNSNLPAIIKKYVLREMFEQIEVIEQKQYEQAVWNTEHKKENEKKEKKENG